MTEDAATARRRPRAVRVDRVPGWFVEAMRLFRRAPLRFVGLSLAVIVLELVAGLVPVVGTALGAVLVPLVAAGLLYASLAADRGEPVRARFAVLAFAAPPRAVAALVVAGLVEVAVEAIVVAWIEGVNLLDPASAAALSPAGVLAMYVAGIAASLPLTFVPFAALFDGEGVRSAFASSLEAFARNLAPLAAYAAGSFLLLILGALTYGVGLLIALPLWAASSYVAWKDVYAVGATGRP